MATAVAAENGWLRQAASRLSRRLIFWVFLCVVFIEAVILVPSYGRRRQELLNQVGAICRGAMVAAVGGLDLNRAPADLLADAASRLVLLPHVDGVAMYGGDGQVLRVYGANPPLVPHGIGAVATGDKYYDIVVARFRGPEAATLAVRYQAAPVDKELRAFLRRIAGLVLIISLVVTAGAALALGPLVVRPVLRLRRDLIRAGEAVSRDEEAPVFASATEKRVDELGEVIRAFTGMYERITAVIAERKRAEAALHETLHQLEQYSRALNNELLKGREIQLNFLPPELPSASGWELAAFFRPARQVSGDFYDAFELADGRLGVVVADVCDKGVGAALFMALCRSLLRIFSGQAALHCLEAAAVPLAGENAAGGYVSPPYNSGEEHLQAMRLTNTYLVQNHGDLGMFATVFFGVLNPQSGELSYINCGHVPPVLLPSTGGRGQSLEVTGPAVGISATSRFAARSIRLQPGDLLLAYTDGVPEAVDEAGRFWGQERLLTLLVDRRELTASGLLERISREIEQHSREAEQFDDITMLALRRADAI